MDAPSAAAGSSRRINWRRLAIILAVGCASGVLPPLAAAHLRQRQPLPRHPGRLRADRDGGVHLVVRIRPRCRRPARCLRRRDLAGGPVLRLVRKGARRRHAVRRHHAACWLRNVLRSGGVDLGDVVHADRLASPPLVVEPSADDFPQFLGPRRDGILHLAAGRLVVRLVATSAPRNLADQGRARLVGLRDRRPLCVHHGRCIRPVGGASGLLRPARLCAVQWVHSDDGLFESQVAYAGPRATPTYHEGKLLTLGSLGRLSCFEAATGRRLWTHDLTYEYQAPLPDWAMSSSPLVVRTQAHGDVVVQCVGGVPAIRSSRFGLQTAASFGTRAMMPPAMLHPCCGPWAACRRSSSFVGRPSQATIRKPAENCGGTTLGPR